MRLAPGKIHRYADLFEKTFVFAHHEQPHRGVGATRRAPMRIMDYEKSNNLNDVAISLTREEAEDLALYLRAMLQRPQVSAIHLSEFSAGRIEKEIRFDIA